MRDDYDDPAYRRPETVVVDRRGGGGGVFLALVLLIVLAVGLYLYRQQVHSDAMKNTALSRAASHVGAAAKDVGSAVDSAASNVKSDVNSSN